MRTRAALTAGALGWVVALLGAANNSVQARPSDLLVFHNDAGQMGTFSDAGAIDVRNPFFQDIGTNGRRCVSCHTPDSAWGLSVANVQARFRASGGSDPLFSNNDGSVCEGAAASTIDERRAAYRLLLSHGVIRVGMDVPPNAEFALESVSDPNHCAPASNDFSLYRRPLPAANLPFLTAVMWDGRESFSTTTMRDALLQQANDATRGHALAARDLTSAEANAIVDFESSLFAAQVREPIAGSLTSSGATGGPAALAGQPFFVGINDPVGLNPTGLPFDSHAFGLFEAWLHPGGSPHSEVNAMRMSIARGEQIFNTHPITITNVGGLNGQTFASGVTLPASFTGTCSTCHDAPNVGDHSISAALNIGISDPSVAPYLPVYTLRRIATGDVISTTDPGRALVTGKWADIGKFKGPILRGVASRAPYFHNGSAATLADVVDFYNQRFAMGLTAQERADLVAFLRSL